MVDCDGGGEVSLRGSVQDAGENGGAGSASGASGTARELPLGGRRLLIADDEPTIRQSLHSILTSLGAAVDVARDGRQAVEMGLAVRYDLVLSDIRMPYKNGYEVYSEIRAARAETSVLLMTAFGYDPSHSIVRASEDGLRAVLLKPFKMRALFEQINLALGTELRMPSGGGGT